MRLLRPTAAAAGTAWIAEVDYGSGWAVYGPPLPYRASAEALVKDLRRNGGEARVRELEPSAAPGSDD